MADTEVQIESTDSKDKTQWHEWGRFLIGVIIVLAGGWIASDKLSAKKQVLEAQEALAGDLSAEFSVQRVVFGTRGGEVSAKIRFINDSLTDVEIEEMRLDVSRVISTPALSDRIEKSEAFEGYSQKLAALEFERRQLASAISLAEAGDQVTVNLTVGDIQTSLRPSLESSAPYGAGNPVFHQNFVVTKDNVIEAIAARDLLDKHLKTINEQIDNLQLDEPRVFLIGKCSPDDCEFQPVRSFDLAGQGESRIYIDKLSEKAYPFRLIESPGREGNSAATWFKYEVSIAFRERSEHESDAPKPLQKIGASVFTNDSTLDMPSVVCSPVSY
jgi:hypothetical protein